jgi:hypothetical protein
MQAAAERYVVRRKGLQGAHADGLVADKLVTLTDGKAITKTVDRAKALDLDDFDDERESFIGHVLLLSVSKNEPCAKDSKAGLAETLRLEGC